MEEPKYTHILQESGILKNFSIAKTLTVLEMEKIKEEIKKSSSSEKEYREKLQKRMNEVGNMHNKNQPIPGIIYLDNVEEQKNKVAKSAKYWSDRIKNQDNFNKYQLTLLISLIASELGLSNEDFNNIEDSD